MYSENVRCPRFQQLKWISDIRKYITADAVKQLVHVFVTSRMDGNCTTIPGYPGLWVITGAPPPLSIIRTCVLARTRVYLPSHALGGSRLVVMSGVGICCHWTCVKAILLQTFCLVMVNDTPVVTHAHSLGLCLAD